MPAAPFVAKALWCGGKTMTRVGAFCIALHNLPLMGVAFLAARPNMPGNGCPPSIRGPSLLSQLPAASTTDAHLH